MNVGILTFHEIYNPGAFLQCYGTQTLLEKLGHRPEVINYTSPPHRHHPLKYAWKLKHRLPFRWRSWMDACIRDQAFLPERKQHLRLSPYIQTGKELQQRPYDAVLVGADIVWNYKTPHLGRDPVYFGENLKTKKLISFAVSCGECSPDDDFPDFVKTGLKRFHRISVRDINAREIVRRASGREANIICDPSFHLWEHPVVRRKRDLKEKHILLYLMSWHASDSLIAEVKKLRAETGLPVRAVLYRNKFADENIMNCGPFNWLEYLANAEYVVTNTFHGLIFSAMTGANFVFEVNHAIKNKVDHLLPSTGLSERLFNGDNSLRDLLNTPFDHERFLERVREQAGTAESFLLDALE